MPPGADKHSKTEHATGYKLGKAREEGQVAKSQDLTSTVSMIAGLVAVSLFLPRIVSGVKQFFITVIRDYNYDNIVAGNVDQIFSFTIISTITMALPILLIIWSACFVAAVVQVGFKISTKALEPNLAKLDPIKGFQNLFSLKSVVKTGISIVKMIFIAVVAASVLWSNNNALSLFAMGDINLIMSKSAAILWELIFKASVTLFILAILDFFYQKWDFMENMKMTKEEVKEEHKMLEGNPTIKSKIKSLQRRGYGRKSLQENVKEADVVVVNPFHIAVALKYDREGGSSAPIVVAKGARLLAQRIKEAAKDSRIEIVQNIPLARALYKQCKVGLEITPDLYIAVAEVLAIVFKKRTSKAQR